MIYSLHDRIVSLIPSASLREAMAAEGFRLSDKDMLSAAFLYSPDFNSRLDILRELEGVLTGELKAYASRLIDTQRRMLEEFTADTPGAVYEVSIKTEPDAFAERYVCGSYKAALDVIPLFFRTYDCAPSPSARYTITRLPVLSGTEGELSFGYGLDRMILLSDLTVLSVELAEYEHYAEQCGGQCWECRGFGAECHEILFPCFAAHGDAVSFTEPGSGNRRFGIVYQFSSRPDSFCYVIPLDSVEALRRDFENIHHSHRHIPSPLVERISPCQLPEELNEAYAACKAFFSGNSAKEK